MFLLFKTSVCTVLALIAFAANSILCRLALSGGAIDSANFASIRLLSGAIVLWMIMTVSKPKITVPKKGNWTASFLLFIYAVSFSYAYVTLETGTGALILFGAVQITMILMSLLSGTRLHISEWIGVVIAFGGFVYLILPGVSTPSVIGFFLMTIAGISWGLYTLKGQASTQPLIDTTYNFLRTIPLVIVLVMITLNGSIYSVEGILLAVLSGSLASGVGYTVWYVAISRLSSIQAAVFQLLVPVIAAIGGVMFISEVITMRLGVSAMIILSGILIVIWGGYNASRKYKVASG